MFLAEDEFATSKLYSVTIIVLVMLGYFVYGTTQQQGKTTKVPNAPPNSGAPIGADLLFMIWDTPGYIERTIRSFKGIPVRLRLLFTDFFVVSGPSHIMTVWKEPNMHIRAYRSVSLNTMFRIPDRLHKLFLADNSGIWDRPKPGTNVPSHLRIDYENVAPVHKLMTGPGLKGFFDRYSGNLFSQLLATANKNPDWLPVDDLWTFLSPKMTSAMVHSMFGERITTVNPDFLVTFERYCQHVHKLSKQQPRWLIPEAYDARDKCLESIKLWQEDVRAQVRGAIPNGVEWDSSYGADAVRSRHVAWSRMPGMDLEATAADDLSFIWGANANFSPACYWIVADVIKRPALFASVKDIVSRHIYRNAEKNAPHFVDLSALCNEPLLESVYAETLRLRTGGFQMRSPEHEGFRLGQWSIPKDGVLCISSYYAQMDREVWEKNNGRPVTEFWAERFLQNRVSADGLPQYSLDEYRGSWIPYGGGNRMCPGRHFSKQAMIYGLAAMLTLFDIEILESSSGFPENDMHHFGLGSFPPDRKLPVRIRRRGQG